MERPKRKITDLDSLEKEIYLLKLESKLIEAKLDHNLDYLKHNYPGMLFNSFFSGNAKQNNPGFKHSFFKNEGLNTIVTNMGEHIAEYASEKIKERMEKIFGKK